LVADDVLTVLRALSDPKRFRLFCALRDSERCVRDLVESEGLPQPLVSHHLRVLSAAGLVRSRKVDGFSMYAVDPDGMAEARAATAALLDPDRLAAAALPGGNPECCREPAGSIEPIEIGRGGS
jgi:DNA-binding transcriptional ArsR family regulator